MKALVSHDELLRLLAYDPDTGVFVWRVTTNWRKPTGSEAGVVSDGRRKIMIDGRQYRAHRLAWFYTHGVWPSATIDHWNTDSLDNRIDNLRDVTQCVNNQNRRSASRRSKTGVLGVTLSGNKFSAFVGSNGKNKYLGSFNTSQAAHEAYVAAKRELHQGCTL